MELKKNPKLDLSKKRPMFLSIGLMTSLLFVTTAFQWSTVLRPMVVFEYEDPWEEPAVEIIATDQPPPKRPKVIQPSFNPVANEVKPDDIEVIVDTNIDDVDLDDLIVDIPIPDEPIIEPPVDFASNMPEPLGGMKAFQKFLARNIRYPNQARRMGIHGKVFVQFVVNKDGSITEIKTIKGIGSGCDEEAERVMALLPKWRPGRQGARRVAVRMIMPINFRLN